MTHEASAIQSAARALGRRSIPFLLLILLAPVLSGSDLSAAAAAAASPAKLARIRVQGSKRFPEAQIIRASGLKLKAPAGPKTFKEAADRLAATGAFAEITYRYQPGAAGLSVTFRLTDAEKFLPCRFTNFVWFTEKELQDELRSRVPLFAGEVPLTGNLPDQLDAALENLLKTRGIPGTVHHSMFGREGGPIEAVRFRVRGAQILIRRVEFTGAGAVDLNALQAAVKPLHETDYDQSFVSAFAANNVRPLYWEKGYLQVACDEPSAALIKDAPDNAAGTPVAITIPVREGLQIRLAEIHWSGNTVFTSAELEKYIRVRSGDPANSVELARNLESLKEPYASRGYLHAAVESKPSLHEATRTVSYEFVVHEGDLYRMGKLTILGLDASHTQALAKSSKLRSGDPYDKSYWSAFLSGSGRHLPQNPRGWKISSQPSVNEAAKTVDMSITFASKDAP